MKHVNLLPKKSQRPATDIPALVRKEIRAATLFAQAMAESSNLHPTDIRCLDFLSEQKIATAGDLAKITNLTTGAVTAVIDRMERAGIVQRTKDGNDRRKVVVMLSKNHHHPLKAARALFIKDVSRLLSEYKESELRTIADWNIKIATLLQERTKIIRASKKRNAQQ